MGKLKLQMHVSIDGMVSGSLGRLPFNWDEELRQYSLDNAANVDIILIGRKLAPEFIRHWKSVAETPDNPDCKLGKRITDLPKVVFSKSLEESEWPNATVTSDDIVAHVTELKKQRSGSLLTYGGVGFASSLVEHDLIDEYHFLLNPIASGKGLTIFSGLNSNLRMKLGACRAFSCGTVLLRCEPSRDHA